MEALQEKYSGHMILDRKKSGNKYHFMCINYTTSEQVLRLNAALHNEEAVEWSEPGKYSDFHFD